MHENDKQVDNHVAAMLLGVSENYLRQLVYRKKLVPTGRQKRRSMFLIADVMALKTQRAELLLGKK